MLYYSCVYVLGIAIDFSSLTFHCIFLFDVRSVMPYYNKMMMMMMMAVDCVPVTYLPSRRHLRSAESGCLAVTGTMTTLGTRNFAVAGAKVWNSLPVDLRLLSRSLRTFGHKLKHYLFMSEP